MTIGENQPHTKIKTFGEIKDELIDQRLSTRIKRRMKTEKPRNERSSLIEPKDFSPEPKISAAGILSRKSSELVHKINEKSKRVNKELDLIKREISRKLLRDQRRSRDEMRQSTNPKETLNKEKQSSSLGKRMKKRHRKTLSNHQGQPVNFQSFENLHRMGHTRWRASTSRTRKEKTPVKLVKPAKNLCKTKSPEKKQPKRRIVGKSSSTSNFFNKISRKGMRTSPLKTTTLRNPVKNFKNLISSTNPGTCSVSKDIARTKKEKIPKRQTSRKRLRERSRKNMRCIGMVRNSFKPPNSREKNRPNNESNDLHTKIAQKLKNMREQKLTDDSGSNQRFSLEWSKLKLKNLKKTFEEFEEVSWKKTKADKKLLQNLSKLKPRHKRNRSSASVKRPAKEGFYNSRSKGKNKNENERFLRQRFVHPHNNSSTFNKQNSLTMFNLIRSDFMKMGGLDLKTERNKEKQKGLSIPKHMKKISMPLGLYKR